MSLKNPLLISLLHPPSTAIPKVNERTRISIRQPHYFCYPSYRQFRDLHLQSDACRRHDGCPRSAGRLSRNQAARKRPVRTSGTAANVWPLTPSVRQVVLQPLCVSNSLCSSRSAPPTNGFPLKQEGTHLVVSAGFLLVNIV